MKKNLKNGFIHNKTGLISPFIVKTILLVFSMSFLLTATVSAQDKKITLKYDKVSLEDVIWNLKKQSGLKFVYSTEDVRNIIVENLDVKDVSIEQVLDICLANTNLAFQKSKKTIVIVKKEKKNSVQKTLQKQDVPQKKTISGVIKDEEGLPLPGATVLEKGTMNGVTTNVNGKFSLEVNATEAVLKISFIGFESREVPVGSQSQVDVTLEPQMSILDEVVVTGYGSTKIKDATGAISFISAKEIKEAPIQQNVQSLLQGRSAGVNVMVQSSAPDSPISVIIRGTSSLSGDSQPLWIIDGVPEYGAGTSGDVSNTLYNLNLDDVESINILKDASSAAIYGSRAANGVVIVTTRKGSSAKPRIDFSTTYSFKNINNGKYRLLDVDEFKDFVVAINKQEVIGGAWSSYRSKRVLDYEAWKALRTSQYNADMLQVLPDAFGDGNTNWWDEMTQQAWSQKHTMSIHGGSDVSRYYISLSYGLDKGVMINSDAKNYGARIRLDTKLAKFVSYNINLSVSGRETRGKNALMDAVTSFRPDIPAYNEDGTIYDAGSYFIENPLVSIQNIDERSSRQINFSNYFLIEPIKNLSVKTMGSLNYSNSKSNSFQRPGTSYTSHNGRRSVEKSDSYTAMWENILTYMAKFKEDHEFDIMAGFSMERRESESITANAEDFPDENKMISLEFGSNLVSPYEFYSASSMVSAFGRFNYKFKDRYLATFTYRADGSSRFGPENRWGYFPSGAVAWLISEEPFMKSLKEIIPYLKLRISIGKSGSQNLGNYEWRKLMDAATAFDQPALIPGSQIGNPFLQWEETKQLDIGLDYGILNERVRGTIGYYKRKISNMIFSKTLAPSTAYTTANYNIAGVTNHGIEFDVTADVIRKTDLKLSLTFNIARNFGKVDKLDGVLESIDLPAGWYYTSQSIQLKPGEPLGNWFGFQTAGRWFATMEEIYALRERSTSGYNNKYFHTYDRPGGLYIIDQNGDGKIDGDDRTELGSNFNPKAFGGFNVNLTWKAFNISAYFTYSYGNKKYWYALYNSINSGSFDNQYAIVLDSYTFTGDPYSDYPGHPKNYNYNFNEKFLFDASYIRLNTLTLNYNVPRKYFKNTMIEKLTFNFQVTNLFTITKYPGMDPQGNWDPEWDASFFGMGIDRAFYPPAKTFNFGVKLTLK